jgi:hypothetical protein
MDEDNRASLEVKFEAFRACRNANALDEERRNRVRAARGRPRWYRLLNAGFTFFTALLLAGASVFVFISIYQPEIFVQYVAVARALHLPLHIGIAVPFVLFITFAFLALFQGVRALAMLLDLYLPRRSKP